MTERGDTAPGDPFVLGATVVSGGTNFAVYSEIADAIEVCLFDDAGHETRVELAGRRGHVHHELVPNVGVGQRYGLRVHGRWHPASGHFANPAKLLVDPYARAIDSVEFDAGAALAHDADDPSSPSTIDSAGHVPVGLVVDDDFEWGDDVAPRHSMNHSIIYETHVRGMTMRHPAVPPEQRGTYAGMAHPEVIDHLVRLGVTAVELLPVHHSVTEPFLADRGLVNYWGYSTLGFFAPHVGYSGTGSAGGQVGEFKAMVAAFHRAGIEVILDVVYNHTAEGGPLGPTLSLRGIDNLTYYRTTADGGSYADVTGTGNTLDFAHPATQRLVMDSLRYWVEEMRVDGFRFDLASTLARRGRDPEPHAPLMAMIDQDPVVNRVKLIAEPWDVGPHGFQLGSFPPMWSEWNASYRDDVRDFWRGGDHALRGFAKRFTGSADIFDRNGRRPTASINFVTAHDGFTLADLVSHDRRHNEANGELNEDGHRHTRSWNGGVEGPTDDQDVRENRRRRQYSMLTSLMLSQGVPMLLGGDELGRSQQGNNNAYCQDNELSWYDWDDVDTELLAYTSRLISLRKRHPVFRRREFFEGRPSVGTSLDDVGWFTPEGHPMTHDDWHVDYARAIAVFLNGNALGPAGIGHDTPDASYLCLCNAADAPQLFTVPEGLGGERWRVVLDTADATARDGVVRESDEWTVGAWSVTLLQRDRVVPERREVVS